MILPTLRCYRAKFSKSVPCELCPILSKYLTVARFEQVGNVINLVGIATAADPWKGQSQGSYTSFEFD